MSNVLQWLIPSDLPADSKSTALARTRLSASFTQQQLASLIAPTIITMFITAALVGSHPFTPRSFNLVGESPQAGTLFNKIYIIGVFLISTPIMLIYARNVWRLACANLTGVAIVVWSIISAFWAIDPELSIRRGASFMLSYFSIVILVTASRSRRTILYCLVYAFLVVLFLDYLTMLLMPKVSHTPIGEKGIFDGKNEAGTITLLTVIALSFNFFIVSKTAFRVIVLIAYVMSWYFLLLTTSKTSISLALIITVLSPFVYLTLKKRTSIRIILPSVALIFIVVFILTLAALDPGNVALRLIFGDLTFTLRTPIWTEIIKSSMDCPWLGYGFGSFWDIGTPVNPFKHAPPDAFYMDPLVINEAHNGYLDQLLQTGIIGLIFAIFAIIRCLFLLQFKEPPEWDSRSICIITALLSLVIAIILNNLLESYLFFSNAITYIFFVLMLQAEKINIERG